MNGGEDDGDDDDDSSSSSSSKSSAASRNRGGTGRRGQAPLSANQRLEQRIVARAEAEEWGLSDGVEAHGALLKVLRQRFGGEVGVHVDFASKEQLQPPRGRVPPSFSRADFMSLAGHGWLVDTVVEALLTSHFPENQDQADENGVVVPCGQEMNALIHASEESLAQADWDPAVFLSESIKQVVSIYNERNRHWFAFRVTRETGQIEIFDSWSDDDLENQVRRETEIEDRLTKVFNWLLIPAHPVWQSLEGQWQVIRRPAFQQINTDDCGVHALQNAVDLVRRGAVQEYHDARVLRKRSIQRLGRFMAGDYGNWGEEDAFADQLRRDWQVKQQQQRRRQPQRPQQTAISLTGGSGDNEVLGRVIQQLQDAVLAQAVLTPSRLMGDLNELELPVFNMEGFISHADAVHAILHAAGRDLSWDEICACYADYCARLNRPLGPGWKKAMGVTLSRRSGIFRKYVNHDGRQMYAVLNPMTVPAASAQAFYGKDMARLYKQSQDCRDDIETRPTLLVVIHRLSGRNNGVGAYELRDEWQETEDDVESRLDYWLAVYNSRTIKPTRIQNAADYAALDATRDHFLWHSYDIVRSSTLGRVFERNDGIPSAADNTMTEILDTMESTAEDDGTRPIVKFLVSGIDGWFTSDDSWTTLASKWPHLDLRATYLMPAERVVNLPQSFKVRRHEGEPDAKAFAWAHVDVGTMARIVQALRGDPQAAIQWQRMDQTAILHALRHVHQYKAEWLRGPFGNEPDLFTRQQAHPIGEELNKCLQRNSFGLPQIEKKCCNCGQQADDTWIRGPCNEADVLCDECGAEEGTEQISEAAQQRQMQSETTRAATEGQQQQQQQPPPSALGKRGQSGVDENSESSRPRKKRAKAKAACRRCKARKVGCDLRTPCGNCFRRGEDCKYGQVTED